MLRDRIAMGVITAGIVFVLLGLRLHSEEDVQPYTCQCNRRLQGV